MFILVVAEVHSVSPLLDPNEQSELIGLRLFQEIGNLPLGLPLFDFLLRHQMKEMDFHNFVLIEVMMFLRKRDDFIGQLLRAVAFHCGIEFYLHDDA